MAMDGGRSGGGELVGNYTVYTKTFGRVTDGYYCGLLRDPDGAREWQLVLG